MAELCRISVKDSFEVDLLREVVITQAESDAFVGSRGTECPKCGKPAKFVPEEGGGPKWYFSGMGGWGEERMDCAAIGFMCCDTCCATWLAIYTPPRVDASCGDPVCPMCACVNISGDTAFPLHDEMLQGMTCKCGAKWYERWPLTEAEAISPAKINLDDPSIEWA